MGNNSSREMNRFDVVKGIGIILMIVGHSKCPKSLYGIIYGFHMPLFFIVSGMLYDKEKWEKCGFVELMKKRAKSYLLPYFALSGINLFLNAINELSKYPEVNDWLDSQIYHTGWIIYGSSVTGQNPNSTPLWFLPCLFISCFILYFVEKLSWGGQIGIYLCLFGINRVIFYTIPEITPKTLPWHMEVALIGAVLMGIGYHIQKHEALNVIEKNRMVLLVVLMAGILGDCINYRKVGLASNRVGNPLAFLICSIAMTLTLLILSHKILKTAVGQFLAFCGNSTMIFMGFNYYFNTMSAKLWKKIPVLNNYKYTWWMKSIVVISLLVLTSYLWKLMLRKYYKWRRGKEIIVVE